MHTERSRSWRRLAAFSLVLALVSLGPAAGAFAKEKPKDKKEKPANTTPNDHPSGKDRSTEPAQSGTQGKSQSDPDGMANGGADKPGGSGGFDEDKDGNNGCGNDDDFEDDNNGWCGRKPKPEEIREEKEEEQLIAAVLPAEQTCGPCGIAVMRAPATTPRVVTAPAEVTSEVTDQVVTDQVMGIRLRRSTSTNAGIEETTGRSSFLGAVLPTTGALTAITIVLLLGAAAVVYGLVLSRA